MRAPRFFLSVWSKGATSDNNKQNVRGHAYRSRCTKQSAPRVRGARVLQHMPTVVDVPSKTHTHTHKKRGATCDTHNSTPRCGRPLGVIQNRPAPRQNRAKTGRMPDCVSGPTQLSRCAARRRRRRWPSLGGNTTASRDGGGGPGMRPPKDDARVQACADAAAARGDVRRPRPSRATHGHTHTPTHTPTRPTPYLSHPAPTTLLWTLGPTPAGFGGSARGPSFVLSPPRWRPSGI